VNQSKTKKKTLASVRCRLNFPDEQVFVEKYARHISKTGIFAKTSKPKAVGEQLRFEFLIADGTPVIRGRGEVTWNRRSGAQSGAPPGMGIKFLSLDEKGKEIVDRVLDYKKARKEEFNQPSLYSMAPPKAGEEDGRTSEAPDAAEAPDRSAKADGASQKEQKLDMAEIDAFLNGISAPSATIKTRAPRRSLVAQARAEQKKREAEEKERREAEQVAAEVAALESAKEPAKPEETPEPEPEPEPEPSAVADVKPEPAESASPDRDEKPEPAKAAKEAASDAGTATEAAKAGATDLDMFTMLEEEIEKSSVPPPPAEEDAAEEAIPSIEPDVEIAPVAEGDDAEVDIELDAASEVPPPSGASPKPSDEQPPSSPSSPPVELSQEELQGILEDVYGEDPQPAQAAAPAAIIQENELDDLLDALEDDDSVEEIDELEEIDDLEMVEIEE
jgi:uncharacterized protein (TIGR02266 family)